MVLVSLVTHSLIVDRVAAESDKCSRLNEQISHMQLTLQQKEQEYQRAVHESLTATTSLDVNDANRKLDQTMRENLDLQHR